MRKQILAFSFLLTSYSFTIAQTWSAVGTGIKGSFTQLITCNNKLYANGIDSLNGKAVSFAYWDGNTWHRADSGLTGQVTAMAVYEGKLYVGTTEKLGANAIYRLMFWNDTLWTKVSTLNGPINALMAFKGSLYAGGKFTMADTTKVKYIARWNDTTWHAAGKNLSNNVRAIAVFRNTLYVGGQFSEVLKFNGRSWEPVTGSNKSIRMSGWVKAFCLYNDELYACGEFNYLARWDGNDWGTAGSLNDGASAIAECNTSIYVGGDFISTPGGEYSYHIAKYKASIMSWNCMGGVLYSGGDCKPYTGTVWALAEYKGDLYIGGQFMIAGGKTINNIARFTSPEKTQ
ncbi:MAG TPA: hypothetical protein VK890_02995 [Bacteroidia bacterium]|jgi:hypothetical protein|nr:hypothetical protein [Bacteroidia bacterium]